MKFPVLLPNIFNHPFTYESDLKLKTGDYVVVPFGKNKVSGVIWDDFEQDNKKKFKIKRILKKLAVPALKKDTIKFLNWFAQYNLIPKGMALKLTLLSNHAIEKFTDDKYKDFLIKIKDNLVELSLEQKQSLKMMNKNNDQFKRKSCYHYWV